MAKPQQRGLKLVIAPICLPFRSILITGGSSGIGAAVAKAISNQGVTIILGGRDKQRLERVQCECQERGAQVIHWQADIANISPALQDLLRLDDIYRFDLALLNAGVGDSCDANDELERPEITASLADVNFRAPAAMASFLAGRMARRSGGAICLVGSSAAWTPLPMAPGYAASKAAIETFARSLDSSARSRNVKITLATPGFIDTPMSQRLECWQPFLMDVDQAAKIIIAAIAAGKREVVFPWQFRILRTALRFLPAALVRRFLERSNFRARRYDPDR